MNIEMNLDKMEVIGENKFTITNIDTYKKDTSIDYSDDYFSFRLFHKKDIIKGFIVKPGMVLMHYPLMKKLYIFLLPEYKENIDKKYTYNKVFYYDRDNDKWIRLYRPNIDNDILDYYNKFVKYNSNTIYYIMNQVSNTFPKLNPNYHTIDGFDIVSYYPTHIKYINNDIPNIEFILNITQEERSIFSAGSITIYDIIKDEQYNYINRDVVLYKIPNINSWSYKKQEDLLSKEIIESINKIKEKNKDLIIASIIIDKAINKEDINIYPLYNSYGFRVKYNGEDAILKKSFTKYLYDLRKVSFDGIIGDHIKYIAISMEDKYKLARKYNNNYDLADEDGLFDIYNSFYV